MAGRSRPEAIRRDPPDSARLAAACRAPLGSRDQCAQYRCEGAQSRVGAHVRFSRSGMALTKVLAGEGAPHNVLVNALHVGLIDSDQWVRRHAQSGTGSYEAYLAKMGE